MSRLLALLLAFAPAFAAGDFYQLLGVRRDASQREISASFRKLSLMWHPDKNLDNRKEAESRMRELSEAYATLSNSEERRIYDAGRPFQALRNQNQGRTTGHWYQPTDEQSWYQHQPPSRPAQPANGQGWYQPKPPTKLSFRHVRVDEQRPQWRQQRVSDSSFHHTRSEWRRAQPPQPPQHYHVRFD